MVDVDAPVPRLVERTGPHAGRVHHLVHGAHVLGRERGVSVALDGPDVSRQHARIEVAGSSVQLADLDSKNGVVVDGQVIDHVVDLNHGARIEIGGVELELQHPLGNLDRVLREAGEVTVTHRRARDATPAKARRGLLVPALSLVLFGAAVLALWWFG